VKTVGQRKRRKAHEQRTERAVRFAAERKSLCTEMNSEDDGGLSAWKVRRRDRFYRVQMQYVNKRNRIGIYRMGEVARRTYR